MSTRTALISGIGIAGPTVAYWLSRAGYRATLVERAPALRTGGYLIDFWASGYDVAERMGLLPELRRCGYVAQEVRFVDTEGHRVGGFGARVFQDLMNGRYITLPRSWLAEVLYRKIEDCCETIFAERIVDLRQMGNRACASFERMPAREFDLVVGADGLHSDVRRLAFGDEHQFEKYLGYTVAAFQVEGYKPRDELVYVSYAVPGKQVARFALNNDRTMFLFVFASDKPVDVAAHVTEAQKKRILHAKFEDVGWECPRILRCLDSCDEIYFDRVSQIRMDRWSDGRVVLVGDAAFCPSLLAGQGAALAMTGAYVLAGELSRAPDCANLAFRKYEQLLRPLIAAKQRSAAQFASEFAPRTSFGIWLRHQVTKTFAVPYIAKFALGRTLLDRLTLPAYSFQFP
jgi:2-polyprenyl-6-methoxyphenol hydroxylase-like FAD-dependent oxidoreductase